MKKTNPLLNGARWLSPPPGYQQKYPAEITYELSFRNGKSCVVASVLVPGRRVLVGWGRDGREAAARLVEEIVQVRVAREAFFVPKAPSVDEKVLREIRGKRKGWWRRKWESVKEYWDLARGQF